MSKVSPGTRLAERTLTTIHGDAIHLWQESGLHHLQFRRFAGCPVCNLHLQSYVRRYEEIRRAGVTEIAFFHSPADELLKHAAGLPFAVVADPGKHLYTAYGVESARRALIDPRSWPMIARAIPHTLAGMLRGQPRPPLLEPAGGRYGLPADLLVDRDGRVLTARYGTHLNDNWTVDDLLALVSREGDRSTPRSD